ncbi:spore cortex-lytic enzyme [Tenuibacillus multivorans]|uniref:Spore cortex-lytic enzyme n=1 Tax=Tenuibacillus multivorans TaxID=237069 RepID=A0A1H0CWD6_9BACI|nr:spore cortex-lytic enzyme [Tenuibacillus multivorans]GEL76139.1 spore cortex-lytic enzyme [Tenuibacillus multivorans]SDN62185.1 N-acetylmuramoyl-L-alanine amidase [Tenuibacillus multivorans]
MSKLKLLRLLVLAVILLFGISTTDVSTNAFTEQVIQQGATGDDVIELQSRLQYIGFYNGKIDGVFGWGTYWAVRNFQNEFGLEVDGLVGQKTKDMLTRASEYDEGWVKEQIRQGREFTHYGGQKRPWSEAQQSQGQNQGQGQGQGQGQAQEGTPEEPTATNVPKGYSQNDIQLLSQAVYSEARGEPYVGQVAIAAVILNRVDDSTFPDSISGVIFEPLAFTAVADGQFYMEPNSQAKEAVIDALNGWDPSGGATYYFNPDTATSDWIWSRPQIKRIGKHVFCK